MPDIGFNIHVTGINTDTYTAIVYFPASCLQREPDVVPQTDLVPTLALLLGVPIPYSSVGQVLLPLFPSSHDQPVGGANADAGLSQLEALWINAKQVAGSHSLILTAPPPPPVPPQSVLIVRVRLRLQKATAEKVSNRALQTKILPLDVTVSSQNMTHLQTNCAYMNTCTQTSL